MSLLNNYGFIYQFYNYKSTRACEIRDKKIESLTSYVTEFPDCVGWRSVTAETAPLADRDAYIPWDEKKSSAYKGR